jgi:2-C-methyl-D-erythritol 2,4-cyclodiphosphate synthase
MRIGQGFDVHRLVPGRPLILGGVEIPYGLGLLGHSDADVLIHAMMDALLGAIGAGDIGNHFPDTDPAYKGADSTALFRTVLKMVEEAGYQIRNIDATVIAQKPKLAGYIPMMRQKLAEYANLEKTALNIKATTTETLGFTGRGEGIAAMAIALLEPKQPEGAAR